MKKLNVLVLLLFATCSEAPSQTNQDKGYTIVESGPLGSILEEEDPNKRVKLLDDFLSKHPPGALLPYVYPSYYQAYWESKNYLKVMEYADKFMALGDQTDAAVRYQALFAWSMAYNKLSSEDPELAANARLRTATAIKVLSEIQKPQNIDDRTWTEQKSKVEIYLRATSGRAAIVLKDYHAADEEFRFIQTLSQQQKAPAP